MAYTFDSLGYAKKLRDGGVPQAQAEVHAEAARDFIMAELATRADLLAMSDLLATKEEFLATKQELRTSIAALQTDLRMTEQRLHVNIAEVQTDLRATEQRLRSGITEVHTELRTTKQELQTELRTSIEAQTLRLTVRLGTMIVVAIGTLAAILKLA